MNPKENREILQREWQLKILAEDNDMKVSLAVIQTRAPAE